jgi:hypothetical protein
MDTEKRELWDQLSNESERAHRAFQTFLRLPSNNRTVIGAYRNHVNNPTAHKASDTWAKWSRDFAWAERASAYDAYLESLRREAYERVIEEEAEFQARQVEQMRNRMLELMTVGYNAVMEWFEDSEWAKSQLRSSDVVRIMALHIEATDKFAPPIAHSEAEGDWDESQIEEDEDDGWGSDIVAKIDAEAEARRAAGDDSEPEEDLL